MNWLKYGKLSINSKLHVSSEIYSLCVSLFMYLHPPQHDLESVPLQTLLHHPKLSPLVLPLKYKKKYSSVFRENRCPPPPKPVYGGNFSHEAVTLKIRSRSPKSNKLLILSDLYRLANFPLWGKKHSNGPCDNMQTFFVLILKDLVWQWP